MTRAGAAPSEVIEVAVKPTGLPSGAEQVMTATPEACRRKVASRASVGDWVLLNSSIYISEVQVTPPVKLKSPHVRKP